MLPTRYIAAMIAFALALAFVGCNGGLEISHSEVEERIRATLNEQVVDWNNENIPAFMETYVKSESLRFASGGNTRRGWQETLERYQSAYPSPEAMGRLAFEDLEIKVLSQEWAEVHGRYRLSREGDYPDATGLFTLLTQNTVSGWKILHDHTSAAVDEN